jgi:hypothetical protein
MNEIGARESEQLIQTPENKGAKRCEFLKSD